MSGGRVTGFTQEGLPLHTEGGRSRETFALVTPERGRSHLKGGGHVTPEWGREITRDFYLKDEIKILPYLASRGAPVRFPYI